MSVNTLNVGETQTLDGRVDTIEVQVGQVLITDTSGDKPTSELVTAEDESDAVIFECKGSPAVTVHGVTGARLNIVYTLDNAVAPTRGQIAKGHSPRAPKPSEPKAKSTSTKSKSTGPTVTELRKKAKAKGIAGSSKMNKAKLEAALKDA